MSTKGIYTALSGAMAQSERMDTIANNLANVNTPGFKRDQQVFNEYLTANEKPPSVIQVPRIPASVESFYDMQGGDKSFVDATGTFTNFSQGSLKMTGNPLDVAIDGDGFFEVATPSGLKFTRVGAFKIDGNGQLVTKDGLPVLKSGEPGADMASRVIRVSGEAPVVITEGGDIMEGENNIGRLSLVSIPQKDSISKVGGSLYEFKANAQPEVSQVANPSLKQGALEMSNVNVVQEMTDMIATTRVFESTQKAIHAYDSMADKLINVVGSVK
ncbi:MAG: flagellar basal-body rod protein FlgF [Bdellovibrio sp. CG10_big_fil_rev_8_21_14_0_10_47_8]|nr:MAG: flagellar basal-body rod protein FlgF [Bdellovibrio sp. CG10_big_fil_rev_8_21_14_0_10_47_8]